MLKPVDADGAPPSERLSAIQALNLVSSVHGREEDLYEGDLSDRIYRYAPFVLTKVNLDDLVLDEFEIDKEWVAELAQKIRKTKRYVPPIIDRQVDPSVIDGNHRLNALFELGEESVWVYVGTKKR